jgi:hypothetical protein
MFPYDSALEAAARQQPDTIAQVLALLDEIDATLADGDGLKWFHWLYRRVTQAVAARVADPAGFTNPAWMALLDVRFARYYFQALASSLAGDPAPSCWRVLFDRRGDVDAARVQFALAGVNAHINHDLAMAIVETFQIAGSAPHLGAAQYADFTSLNTTLEALVDTARRELNVRLLGDALPEVSRLEDTLASWSIVAAREAAWTNAELQWDVREIPLVAGRYLDVIDGLATVVGKALMVPAPRVGE